MKEETVRRLNVTHEWALRRAEKSERPVRFLNSYEEMIGSVREEGPEPETLIDYSDPLRLAAEIEARAAWRRVQRWRTGEGLLKSRAFLAERS